MGWRPGAEVRAYYLEPPPRAPVTSLYMPSGIGIVYGRDRDAEKELDPELRR